MTKKASAWLAAFSAAALTFGSAAALAQDKPKRDLRFCWADYCPCDRADPDYGGADYSICRMKKAGQHVSDASMSAAAAARDARRQIRQWRVSNR